LNPRFKIVRTLKPRREVRIDVGHSNVIRLLRKTAHALLPLHNKGSRFILPSNVSSIIVPYEYRLCSHLDQVTSGIGVAENKTSESTSTGFYLTRCCMVSYWLLVCHDKLS